MFLRFASPSLNRQITTRAFIIGGRSPLLHQSPLLRPSVLPTGRVAYFSRSTQESGAFSLILYNAATFLRRIKRMILKRMVLFRVLFYGTVILTVSAILQAGKLTESESSITPSFFAEHSTLPG